MKKRKRINIVYSGKNKGIPIFWEYEGQFVMSFAATEASDNWLRAARLNSKADAGDLGAAKELERMQNTPLFSSDEWEEK